VRAKLWSEVRVSKAVRVSNYCYEARLACPIRACSRIPISIFTSLAACPIACDPQGAETLIARLEFESKHMKKKFTTIVFKTMRLLEQKGVSCEDLLALLAFSHYDNFSTLFRDAMSIHDLFTKLMAYCSYFNYELLSLIITTFCNLELKETLEEYVSALKQYCQRRIVEVPTHMLRTEASSKNIVYIKMERDFFNTRLNDVKFIQGTLSRLLEMPLQLLSIEEGCIQLMFDALYPLTPLTDDVRRQLAQLDVQQLTIKNVNSEPQHYVTVPGMKISCSLHDYKSLYT
jgi:hypothetical protein